MQCGTSEQAGLIRGAIEHGGLHEFQPVLAAIRDTGALDYTRRQASSNPSMPWSSGESAAFIVPGQSATIGRLCGFPHLLIAVWRCRETRRSCLWRLSATLIHCPAVAKRVVRPTQTTPTQTTLGCSRSSFSIGR